MSAISKIPRKIIKSTYWLFSLNNLAFKQVYGNTLIIFSFCCSYTLRSREIPIVIAVITDAINFV